MSLVTRCPKCQNDFLASLDQLRMHEGLVRCGTCSNIFDAYAHLESELPTLTRRAREHAGTDHAGLDNRTYDNRAHNNRAYDVAPGIPESLHTAASDPAPQPQGQHPVWHEPIVEPQEPAIRSFVADEPEPAVLRHRTHSIQEHTISSQSGPREPAISLQGESRTRDTETASYGRRTPDFLTEAEGPGALVRFFWGALCLLALLGLIAQGIYIYRNDIATRLPFLQPVLAGLCTKLNCNVSLSRHLERISIEASSLQQSAGQAPEGQPVELSLRLTLRNRYDKNQPWPHLSLELKDASGATVVRKTIAPYQYLPPTLVDQPFAAGQEVNLLIPVTVNGLQINGFQLDKFFP